MGEATEKAARMMKACRHFVATGNKKGVPFSRNPLI
jgi:hypothetical protein